jgi:hypothetical protein
MDIDRTDQRRAQQFETPEAALAMLRKLNRSQTARRAEILDELVLAFPPERLRDAASSRFDDLGHGDAETVLQLAEAFASPELLRELAAALVRQPHLAPETAWDALMILDGAGTLDGYPVLQERLAELNEFFEEEQNALHELVEQLDEQPDGVWLALEGLAAVEADVRVEMVAELAHVPPRAGTVEFLRLLSHAYEPHLRDAARRALDAVAARSGASAPLSETEPEERSPGVAEHSLGRTTELALSGFANSGALARPEPRLDASLVTSLDGHGRGYIVLVAEEGTGWSSAAYLCGVLHGVIDVAGHVGTDRASARKLLEEFGGLPDRDCVLDASELARQLLAGTFSVCGPQTPPVLRFWVEHTIGTSFDRRPVPLTELVPDWNPAAVAFEQLAEHARSVLDACEGWVDDSDLTYDLAEELLLRDSTADPDPTRDSGTFRFLFENRLVTRLELDRRMLSWMAAFWHASADAELARAAVTFAWQLAETQHVVPAHPFLIELAIRSLKAAQTNLRRHVDLRDPTVRARTRSSVTL